MLKIATKADVDALVELERRFFGDHAEIREAYDFIVEAGSALLEYKGNLSGALVTISVNGIMANKKRILDLPQESPFRERVARGYLDPYRNREFIFAFMSDNSYSLTRKFKELERAVGFCYGDAAESLEFYRRAGCRAIGTVPNIHNEGIDVILVYDKK